MYKPNMGIYLLAYFQNTTKQLKIFLSKKISLKKILHSKSYIKSNPTFANILQ